MSTKQGLLSDLTMTMGSVIHGHKMTLLIHFHILLSCKLHFPVLTVLNDCPVSKMGHSFKLLLRGKKLFPVLYIVIRKNRKRYFQQQIDIMMTFF